MPNFNVCEFEKSKSDSNKGHWIGNKVSPNCAKPLTKSTEMKVISAFLLVKKYKIMAKHWGLLL